MRKFFFTVVFLSLLTACSGIPVSRLRSPAKIAILPVENLTGFALDKFPATIYSDMEMSALFKDLSGKSVNFPKLLENALSTELSSFNVLPAAAAKSVFKSKKADSYKKKRELLFTNLKADKAILTVLKELHLNKLFTEKRVSLYAGLVLIETRTGEVLWQSGKQFVFNLPASVFSPIGADFSQILPDIARKIISDLLNLPAFD